MGQPAYKRRQNKRNGILDAATSKQQQDAARSQPKKKRVRQMAWEKRGEEKRVVASGDQDQDEFEMQDFDEREEQMDDQPEQESGAVIEDEVSYQWLSLMMDQETS